MTGNMWKRTLLGVLFASALLGVACSSGQREDIGEVAVRNGVAVAGKHELVERGIDVDGGLDCRASVNPTAGTFNVDCKGRDSSGALIRLTGHDTSQGRDGRTTGKFTATVGGRSVFEDSCLGDC